jgi:hypothetical protein
MIPQVIEVPSPLGLRPSGLEDALHALRTAGLHRRLGSPDAVRIDVPPYDGVRDPETGLLNPHGIAGVARDVASAVDATLGAGAFPSCSAAIAALCSDRSSHCAAGAATRRSRLIQDFAAVAADHPPVASRAEPDCVSSQASDLRSGDDSSDSC